MPSFDERKNVYSRLYFAAKIKPRNGRLIAVKGKLERKRGKNPGLLEVSVARNRVTKLSFSALNCGCFVVHVVYRATSFFLPCIRTAIDIANKQGLRGKKPAGRFYALWSK